MEQALSLRALGERSGVAYDTINKLELGRRPAHASTHPQAGGCAGRGTSRTDEGRGVMGRRGNGEGDHQAQGRPLGWPLHGPHGGRAEAQEIYGKTQQGRSRRSSPKRWRTAASGIVFDDENLTVGEYLDRWLTDSVRGTVRESTYSRDKYLLTNHIKPALGRIKLTNLNALHLQGLYRDRLDSGLSGSTVHKMHHILHKALKQAVRWHLIPRNPADAVKAPTPSPKEMHPLSAEQAAAVGSGAWRPSGSPLRARHPHRHAARRVAGAQLGGR